MEKSTFVIADTEASDKLNDMVNFLKVFHAVKPRIRVNTMFTFLAAATLLLSRPANQLTYLSEINEITGMGKYDDGRTLGYLTRRGAKNSQLQGPDWVKLEVDPEHLSRKTVTLTERGIEALEDMYFAIDPDSEDFEDFEGFDQLQRELLCPFFDIEEPELG